MNDSKIRKVNKKKSFKFYKAHLSSTKSCKYLNQGNQQKSITELQNAANLYEDIMSDTIDETTLEALKLLSQYNKNQVNFLKNKPKPKPKKTQINKPNASYTPYGQDSNIDETNTRKMFFNLLIEPWDSFYEKFEDEIESKELKEKFITTMNKIQKNVNNLAGNKTR